MIVQRFLRWVRTAAAGERADATAALARAFLFSDLSLDDRDAAEFALTAMLDDPAPLVRRALAEALASHPDAPHSVVLALAHDVGEVATLVLAGSPLLLDVELVEIVRGGDAMRQIAIASRPWLPTVVSAAIAEVGEAEACLTLLGNDGAEIASASLSRIIERQGHVGAIKETLIARGDLTAAQRQALATKLAGALADLLNERAWMRPTEVTRLVRDACERTTVAIAHGADDVARLVRHLRETEQLTAGLLLRALLAGQREIFEVALAELSGVASSRVCAVLDDRAGAAFTALYRRAGLPTSAEPAFRAVLAANNEVGFAGDTASDLHLRRRMVERVLTHYRGTTEPGADGYLALLRRYVSEAAREEARSFVWSIDQAA